jgi:hypothetical protein
MGAYNILKVNEQCLNCGTSLMLNIQFKFGDTWQCNYLLGEKIRWGGADVGVQNLDKVKVYGISELAHCLHCKSPILEEYDIIVNKDIISSVVPMISLADYDSDVNGNYCPL